MDLHKSTRVLPFELLGLVFHHLCADGPIPLRHLFFVSKSWAQAVLHHPRLWTKIVLDDSFFIYFSNRPTEHACAFLAQCFYRSGLLALDLVIRSDQLELFTPSNARGEDASITANIRRFDTLLQVFRASEQRPFGRVASLSWHHSHGKKMQDNILAVLPEKLPSLKSLTLSKLELSASRLAQFPSCPALETVQLSHHTVADPNFWGSTFSAVASLQLENFGTWVYYDVTTLLRFTLLKHLTLCNASDPPTKASYLATGRAFLQLQFPHLLTLTVKGVMPKEIFSQLLAPNLEALHIEPDAGGQTSLYALEESFQMDGENLHVVFPEEVLSADPEWIIHLQAILSKSRRLQGIFVAPWMETDIRAMCAGLRAEVYVVGAFPRQ